MKKIKDKETNMQKEIALSAFQSMEEKEMMEINGGIAAPLAVAAAACALASVICKFLAKRFKKCDDVEGAFQLPDINNIKNIRRIRA